MCLSGTAEMALASYYADSAIPASELPIKMAAVSRCYRAETSSIQEERGIYRYQHQPCVCIKALAIHYSPRVLFSIVEHLLQCGVSFIDYHVRFPQIQPSSYLSRSRLVIEWLMRARPSTQSVLWLKWSDELII